MSESEGESDSWRAQNNQEHDDDNNEMEFIFDI
jgi:hypothetical protein